MPLQDLTPQLRTRLGRMERTVALFVIVATVLLATGFVYYVYHTAKRKGWFLTRATYFTFARSAAGVKEGDPVKLMGFDVGQITKIEAMPPSDPMFNVYLEFTIRAPYYGYLWTDSRARLTSGDLLGNRFLEVTKGTNGFATYTNAVDAQPKDETAITHVWDDRERKYRPLAAGTKFWLAGEDTPGLAERMESVVSEVTRALPGILQLTNQIAAALTRATNLLVHLDDAVLNTRPGLSNLTLLTAQLRANQGALGEWLLPTNINAQLLATLTTADRAFATTDRAFAHTDTNLTALTERLKLTLENLADITSNLNVQVRTNESMLSEISDLVTNADNLVQGLKRHWLLKGTFKKMNAAPPPPARAP